MVLSVLLLFLLYVIALRFLKKRKRKQALLLAVMVCAALVAVFLFNNPVKKRFDGLTNSSIVLLKKEKYGPGENFNGLEFRLLLWRFTYEILRDNHAFIMGVGPANAQPRLIQKYLDMNMYAGDKSKGTTGYLAYNCHNQFLQISLQSGIIGLIIFLFWCYAMLEKTIKEKNPVLTAIVLIIFIFFISESVFERQYGMILCTVFPLLYLYTTDRQTSKS
jgi:O-antigen ligase